MALKNDYPQLTPALTDRALLSQAVGLIVSEIILIQVALRCTLSL